MRVVLDVHRDGPRYVGTLRHGGRSIPFWGVLELLAALERIDAELGGPDDETRPPIAMGAGDA